LIFADHLDAACQTQKYDHEDAQGDWNEPKPKVERSIMRCRNMIGPFHGFDATPQLVDSDVKVLLSV